MGFKVRTFSLPKPRCNEDLLAIGGQVKRFSLRQLKLATDNFSQQNIIGRGGFGNVYKGYLSEDGSLVAVKRLGREANQGEREFRTEMHFASITAEHPNLLRLRGFCITKKERLLVYPFLPNGDLASRLFTSGRDQCPLDWPTRKRVALGLAKGLAYLHEADSHFNTPLVHLDMKPSNILLDHDLEPILCDFGLCRTLSQNDRSAHYNSNWANQYPFENQEIEEDNKEPSTPEHRAAGLVGGLTKCWNPTVKSDSSSLAEAVGQEARTCTWSCWQEAEASSDSTSSINEAPGMREQELLNFTSYQTNRIYGTYGYMPPEYTMEGIYSIKNDVFGYGITLLELISGRKITQPKDWSGTHYWDTRKLFGSIPAKICYMKLIEDQQYLFVDPRLTWEYKYSSMYMEFDQLLRVALLCVQDSPRYRPKMSQVLQMLQGTIGRDNPLFWREFDPAAIFDFQSPPTAQVIDELELGDLMDSPKLDTEGSISTEFDLTNEVTTSSSHLPVSPKQESSASSKDKEAASLPVSLEAYSSKPQHTKLRPQSKGITIFDSVRELNIQERWKIFLSEVVSEALPTNSKMCRSGMSVDPLCPLCNEYEEDNFHLFFNCDFSKQAWLLAAGVRIDMMVFGSVKEAVGVILKPNDAGFNILPPDIEPSRFTHKGIALMHAIWTHRNQVCFDKASPNVIQMLKDHPDASDFYGTQPPPAAPTQLIHKSTTQNQEQFQAHATSWATFDTDGYVWVASDPTSWVQFESSPEIEAAQPAMDPVILQGVFEAEEAAGSMTIASDLGRCVQCESSPEINPEAILIPRVVEPGIENNKRDDFQVNITSGDFSLSFKFSRLSVWRVILLISLCMNLVSIWHWVKPRY